VGGVEGAPPPLKHNMSRPLGRAKPLSFDDEEDFPAASSSTPSLTPELFVVSEPVHRMKTTAWEVVPILADCLVGLCLVWNRCATPVPRDVVTRPTDVTQFIMDALDNWESGAVVEYFETLHVALVQVVRTTPSHSSLTPSQQRSLLVPFGRLVSGYIKLSVVDGSASRLASLRVVRRLLPSLGRESTLWAVSAASELFGAPVADTASSLGVSLNANTLGSLLWLVVLLTIRDLRTANDSAVCAVRLSGISC
jgi:hypothetical protein